MRLRAIPLLVLVVASIALLGAWTDGQKVRVKDAPAVAKADHEWDAVVEITRRGRRLNGLRPVLEVTDPVGGIRRFRAKQVGPGRYRASVLLPAGGYYTYQVVTNDGIGARGSVYAIAK
jgi:hypothetical protein